MFEELLSVSSFDHFIVLYTDDYVYLYAIVNAILCIVILVCFDLFLRIREKRFTKSLEKHHEVIDEVRTYVKALQSREMVELKRTNRNIERILQASRREQDPVLRHRMITQAALLNETNRIGPGQPDYDVTRLAAYLAVNHRGGGNGGNSPIEN